MTANKRISLFGVALLMVAICGIYARPMQAQSAMQYAEHGAAKGQQWSVQVNKVDPGDVNLEPSFQLAIYENLLQELTKTKQFKQVLRDGDHSANDVSDLLTLKTTVQKYTAGSETRRAVTTVSGATKLTVRAQLLSKDGKVILERTVDGNVRFIGSNLRATHNLAHNVAKEIKAGLPSAPAA